MSFFGKMFGAKKEPVPTASEAIQKLRDTELMLTKKQEFLESKIEAELDIAKKNSTKNKRVAIAALKRKKKFEKQLQQLDGTLTTIEMQRESLENANTNSSVMRTMKEAADAMKLAHNNMDVDQIHDMMDDIAEQQNIAQEISDAISNPVAFPQDVDEDELERELNEMAQEELDKELLDVGPAANVLPDVPTEDLPEAAKKEKEKKKAVAAASSDDKELNDLMAWAE